MEIFESEMFENYGIGTLVWGLAWGVLLVRVFIRLGNRFSRKGPERGGEQAGNTPLAPSAPPVGRPDAGPLPDPDSTLHTHRATDELDSYSRTRSKRRQQEHDGVVPSQEKWDSHGFDPYGVHRETGAAFDRDGFDKHGYDQEGYDRQGYDFQGYNRRGSRRRS